ncbi:MAG: hypothetical protein EXQ88_07460 [Alphaproteobacteria bacterium]|nr:hypothetical protein [Alphaproteobacteria bacterium]
MASLDLLQQLDRALKRQGPFLVVLLMILYAALPTGAALYTAMLPALPMIVLFAFIVERPSFMPRTTVFAAGLFHDLLLGTPLGLSALLFLALREVSMSQQQPHFDQSLWLQWLGYALAAIAFGVFNLAFMSVWRGAVLNPTMPLLYAVAGIALYPWRARLVRAIAPRPPIVL